jgi:hypothetical protein
MIDEAKPSAAPLISRKTWPAGRAPLILALLLLLPAVLPLAAPGYFFRAHDGHHSVFFLVEFDQVIREGVLWPVWAPDHAHGFGYPTWLVYAPLAYAVAEIFHLLGAGVTDAIKLTWVLGFVGGALGMYLLARRWWGHAAALIASLAYSYAPYHLVQIYVRADLAEFMAWAWFPWAWLALAMLWDDPRPRRAALAALALGLLLLIHTVSLLIFPFVLGAYVLMRVVHDWRGTGQFPARALGWTAGAAGLGGLLAAAFLLPGFVELRYLIQSQWTRPNYDYAQQFVYLNQFLSGFWGFNFALPGPGDGMSFQLGLMPFLGGLLGTLAVFAAGRRRAAQGTSEILPYRAEAALMIALTLAGIFLMTQAALPVWRALPFGHLIQFPWRLLALTMITLALLSAAGVRWLERKPPATASAYVYVAALAIVLASFPYTRPELQPVRPQDEQPVAVMEFEIAHPDMLGGTIWAARPPVAGESPLLPEYLAGQPLQRAAILDGQGAILSQKSGAIESTARVQSAAGAHLRFYIYYFPGWRATVDGQPVEIRPEGTNGLIGLNVPPGEHDVRVRFGPTPVRLAGGALSIAALVVIVVLIAIDGRARKARGPARR